MAASRENTLGKVEHPDVFRVGDTGRTLALIEDPVVDRIQKGDPVFGWEGDERLALYLDPRDRTWDLWRLEHDGVYRCVRRLACDAFSSTEVVPELVMWLVAHDQRRGFNPVDHVAAAAAQRAAAQEKAETDFNEEFAHRLRFALEKDGAL